MRRDVHVLLVLLAGVVLIDPFSLVPALSAGALQGPPGQTSPQLPARDTVRRSDAADAPTFRLRGRVVAADTSVPLRRAVVRITSPQLRQGRSMITDLDGRYEFRDLPAGSYYVTASKTGFLTAQPGNELLGIDSGRSVDIGAAASADNAKTASAKDITLARACAIAGRVVDETGEPVGNVPARLLRSVGGVRRSATVGMFTTNDLGQYRASGLLPGTYFVFAEMPRDPEGGIGEAIWYAPTYYPGTADASAASPIDLSPGQEMTNADIVLTLVPTASVSGVALDAHGRPAADAGVRLQLAQQGVAGTGVGNYTRVQPNGTFTITGVPPGDYVLGITVSQAVPAGGRSASGSTTRRIEYGSARVAVAGSDVTGITVQASAGCSVTGQVAFEGAPPPPRTKLSVAAYEDPSVETRFPYGIQDEPVAADGTFAMPAVFGDRVFRVSGLPDNWVLRAVYVNGRDMTDTTIPLDGRDQLTGVQIVVTDRVTHVTVRVLDERGEPAAAAWIFVVPDDAERSTQFGSRFMRSAVADANGTAKIAGLPPGNYAAVAVKQNPRHVDVYAPDVIEQVRRTGVKFSLHDGDSREVALKVGQQAAK